MRRALSVIFAIVALLLAAAPVSAQQHPRTARRPSRIQPRDTTAKPQGAATTQRGGLTGRRNGATRRNRGTTGGTGMQPQAAKGCLLPPEECPPPPPPSSVPVLAVAGGQFHDDVIPVGSGPYTYTILASNVGTGPGEFFVSFFQNPAMLGLTATPALFHLEVGESQEITISYSGIGLGSFPHQVYVGVEGNNHFYFTQRPISVVGQSIIDRIDPPDAGTWFGANPLEMTIGQPGAVVDSTSIKNWIDGAQVTTGITSTATPNGRNVKLAMTPTAGTHDWTTYGCAGIRCDTLHTSFTTSAVTLWNMDDSLSPYTAGTGMGGVGPIPLPPDSLRGCPMQPLGIELRITEPMTTVAGQSQGTVFVASYEMSDGLLRISFLHIQNKISAQTCDNPSYYPYLPPSQFNYGWWQTEWYPGMFANWPASWGPYAANDPVGPAEHFAFAGEEDDLFAGWRGRGGQHGPNAGATPLFPGSPTRDGGRLLGRLAEALQPAQSVTRSEPGAVPAHRLDRLLGHLAEALRPTSSAMLPDPGAVDTASTTIVLNGTTIVSGDQPNYPGVVKTVGWKGGQTWTIPVGDPVINHYTSNNPSSQQGGWNELVVSIATTAATGAKRTYERSRFVMGPQNLPAGPAQLTALRRFEHASTSECPAFGNFQCGSLFLTEGIPGFVSRDRERSLALVYRSGSQRVPTLFPIRYQQDRYHPKPDTLQVRVSVDSQSVGPVYRYAGLTGGVNSAYTPLLEPGASADRVLGVEVPAAATAEAAIRYVSVAISNFYGAEGVKVDSLNGYVVQVYNTTTASSRFGAGWSLGALQRLYHGLKWGGDNAKVLATADGSFQVFRQTGTGPWRAPAGSTAQLIYLAAGDAGAKWILSLDDGSRMGFIDAGDVQAGRLAWTEDLIGNRTTYLWGTNTVNQTGADSLLRITDPNKGYFEFIYGAGPNGSRVREIWAHAPALAGNGAGIKVDSLGYDATGRLIRVKHFSAPGVGDSTMYAYDATAPVAAMGAMVAQVTDARSTTAKPVDMLVTWDTISGTPVQVQSPVWTGSTRYSTWIRDVWRRSTPRFNYGRTATQGRERLITPDQLRGTVIDLHGPTDFRADPFNGTSYVQRPPHTANPALPGCAPNTLGCWSNASMDQIRTITRDTMGRVTKIVSNPTLGPGSSDSVRFEYDPVFLRVARVIKVAAGLDSNSTAWLDSTSFRYDSMPVTGKSTFARCYRLRTTTGVHHDSTTIAYGATGVGQCLPTSVTAPGNLTSTMAYGPLTIGDVRTVRPTTVTGPDGVVSTVTMDARTWSTASATSMATATPSTVPSTTTYYYGLFGRPDSTRTGADAWKTGTQYIYDQLGRVTHSRTGWLSAAPVSKNFYSAGGQLDSVRVYVPQGNETLDQPVSGGRVETTHYYYNRFGALDSTVGPGSRSNTITADTLARKQGYRMLPDGQPYMTFAGNGSNVRNVYNAQGMLTDRSLSAVTASMTSTDGERFRAPGAWPAGYPEGADGSFGHLGTAYRYGYDVNRNPIWSLAYDVFTKDTIVRINRTFDAGGHLTNETRTFGGKLQAWRNITYNRRGQRLVVSDGVGLIGSGTLTGETSGSIRYQYDSTTGRLTGASAYTTTAQGSQKYAQLSLFYDAAGRVSRRDLQLYDGSGTFTAGTLLRHTYQYDALTGRLTLDSTWASNASSPVVALFRTAAGNYDNVGNLHGATVGTPSTGSNPYSYSYNYAQDGTGRLIGSSDGTSVGNGYDYDGFGNRISDLTPATPGCNDPSTNAVLTYGPDNRLLRKYWGAGSCKTRFVNDQAGNRIAEIDSVGTALVPDRYQRMSYTAMNQLYASITNTVSPGSYDANWNWYDADGLRAKSLIVPGYRGNQYGFTPPFNPTTGTMTYFVYDGGELSMTIEGNGTNYKVRRRFVSLGIDAAVAGRFDVNGAIKTLAIITDNQGTAVGAINNSGSTEITGDSYSRDVFGRSSGGTTGPAGVGAGFAGGGAPNPTGGFTYFRNRWYDPSTGRFITQDPMGMSGGVNLYAYAGNNPVSFSDPWGLCPKGSGGDGKTDGYADCPRGTSGYNAQQAALGKGGFANTAAGVFHSCMENTVCKVGAIGVATYTGARLAWAAGSALLGGGGGAAATGGAGTAVAAAAPRLIDQITQGIEEAGPSIQARANAVMDAVSSAQLPDGGKLDMIRKTLSDGSVMLTGGYGRGYTEILLSASQTVIQTASGQNGAMVTVFEQAH